MSSLTPQSGIPTTTATSTPLAIFCPQVETGADIRQSKFTRQNVDVAIIESNCFVRDFVSWPGFNFKNDVVKFRGIKKSSGYSAALPGIFREPPLSLFWKLRESFLRLFLAAAGMRSAILRGNESTRREFPAGLLKAEPPAELGKNPRGCAHL